MIGETSLGAQEVQEVVQQLGSEYKGTSYHLLERNCNHFSNELCMKLTGNPAPSWVSCCLAHVCRCPSLELRLQQYALLRLQINREAGVLRHRQALLRLRSEMLLQVNRLAGMAIMLHCLLPTSWVPPLTPPTAQPLLGILSTLSLALESVLDSSKLMQPTPGYVLLCI